MPDDNTDNNVDNDAPDDSPSQDSHPDHEQTREHNHEHSHEHLAGHNHATQHTAPPTVHAHKAEKAHDHDSTAEHHKKGFFLGLYEKHYKQMLIFSILLLVFSIAIIGHQYITTGDFVSKGVTLKGGLTLTIESTKIVNSDKLQLELQAEYPKSDINVRTLSSNAGNSAYEIESADLSEQQLVGSLQKDFPGLVPAPSTAESKYSSSTDGPSLGASFFTQTLKAIFIAFLFMSLVVYLYFGSSVKYKWITSALSILAAFLMFYADTTILYIIPLLILAVLIVIYFRDNMPSFGIMLCAFSDVFFSLAIFNLVGLKLNTAGVAAFLMLLGYSIDTDILLAVRVLKRREGSIFDRTMGAMKTGMMMSISALIAVLTAYFLSNSAVIKEIMFILAIGLVGDIIFTWIQNAGILRWHLEKKGWK